MIETEILRLNRPIACQDKARMELGKYFTEQQVVFYLFTLFYCEQDIKSARLDVSLKKKDLEKSKKCSENAKEILGERNTL